MAAGLGFKTFVTGDVLTATDTNGYLMQGVLVFADATARDAAITSPEEGQFAYLKDTNVTTYYTGSAWANLDTTGMTNPMTTTGDTIYSSSGSTPARLGIGTAGQVLTVNSGATAPEWAAVAGGGFTYTGYTPTFTNFTLGNGTINKARYAQSGKLVHVYIQVTLGSTSTVSGNITVALPVTAASDQVGLWTGPAAFSDSGVGSFTGLVQISSTTAAKPDVNDASGTYPKITGLSSTVPFTWTTSDGFRLSFIYEAA